MTIKQLATVSALVLSLAATACAPVFHTGDCAGLTQVAPVGSTPRAADSAVAARQ